jgi:hypothetical protein
VCRLGWDDEHLVRTQLDDLVAGGPASLSFEKQEGLGVGMRVQLNGAAWRGADDEHRDPDSGLWAALEEEGGGAELHLLEVEDDNSGGSCHR